jgi:hypothetical protein
MGALRMEGNGQIRSKYTVLLVLEAIKYATCGRTSAIPTGAILVCPVHNPCIFAELQSRRKCFWARRTGGHGRVSQTSRTRPASRSSSLQPSGCVHECAVLGRSVVRLRELAEAPDAASRACRQCTRQRQR